jgi:hypothetical protein
MKVRLAMSGITLDEAMASAIEINTWPELLDHLEKSFYFWNPNKENVGMSWYGHDKRTGWNTHLITVGGKAALFADSLPPWCEYSHVQPPEPKPPVTSDF